MHLMDIRELYLLTVKENGLSGHEMANLTEGERALLTRGENSRFWLTRTERDKFKVVLTGGVFDVLHIGHVLTLEKAREQGDLLVVVVSTDERVEQVKKRKPIHEMEYRRAMVAALKPVDLAINGSTDIMETFYRVRPDAVVFGYDQKPMSLPVPCKIVHLTDKMDEKLAKTSRIIRDLGL